MAAELELAIDSTPDHVLILDLGPAEDVDLAIESLGKTFEPIQRRAVVI
jgi:CRISPR-associated protein Cas2